MTNLQRLIEKIRTCTACGLSATRTNAVPGEGPNTPQVMLIGEGPGFHEDQQGRPFVGPSGKLLQELLDSIKLTRANVYICNIIKCRPPNNRDPSPIEIEACKNHLDEQILLINPQIIVTLGRFSMAYFFPGEIISRIHGIPRNWKNKTVVPMFHPAAALHQNKFRIQLQEDFLNLGNLLSSKQPIPRDQMTSSPQQLNLF